MGIAKVFDHKKIVELQKQWHAANDRAKRASEELRQANTATEVAAKHLADMLGPDWLSEADALRKVWEMAYREGQNAPKNKIIAETEKFSIHHTFDSQ